jgi:hypothetical protein
VAGRGRESFNKRQLEKRRQEQQSAKRQRRLASRDGELPDDAVTLDPDELLERFRLLNEARQNGELDETEFIAQEQEILIALGVQVHE